MADSTAEAAVAGRHLDWDGCFNVRDLGGLPAAGGMVTRRGALVRADALDRLSTAGWRALAEHGVRTVVDLRDDAEQRPDSAPRPPSVATLRVPLGRLPEAEVRARWGDDPVFATPLYYGEYVDRFPAALAAAVRGFAHAAPGGVAVHCSGGRDRTGLVTLAILTVAGVGPEDVVADYLLSAARQPARFAALGVPDPAPVIEAYLQREGTTAEAATRAFLHEVDIVARLRDAGLTDSDVAAVRARTLEPAPG
jgi:protein-tyrosine phosphatase